GLAGAVAANDAQTLAFAHLKIQIPQSPEFLIGVLAPKQESSKPQHVDHLVERPTVELVHLAEATERDGNVRHQESIPRPYKRLSSQQRTLGTPGKADLQVDAVSSDLTRHTYKPKSGLPVSLCFWRPICDSKRPSGFFWAFFTQPSVLQRRY